MNKVFIIISFILSSTLSFADTIFHPDEVFIKFYKQQGLHSDEKDFSIRQIMLTQKIKTVIGGRESIQTYKVIFFNDDTAMVATTDQSDDIILFLIRGNENWLFKKGLRTPLKISLGYQVTGSVSLFDVLRVRFNQYKIGLTEDLLNSKKIELVASDKSISYQYLQVFVDSSTLDIQKIEYQSVSKKTIKQVLLTDYSLVGGRHRFPRWTIQNRLFSTDDYATITYTAVDRVSYPESLFYPNTQTLNRFIRSFKH